MILTLSKEGCQMVAKAVLVTVAIVASLTTTIIRTKSKPKKKKKYILYHQHTSFSAICLVLVAQILSFVKAKWPLNRVGRPV